VDYIQLTVLWVDKGGKEREVTNGTFGVDVLFQSL